MKVIRSYLRVSRESQSNSGLGIEAQRSAISAYVKAHYAGAEVVEYSDMGVSGATPLYKRQGLSTLIEELNADDVVIAYDNSRFARDIMVSLSVETEVNRKGAVLIATTGSNGDSPEDVLMRRILNSFSEFERKKINERTKRALAEKKSQGFILGNAPYGMKISDDRRSFVEINEEQQVIKIVKDLRSTGNTWEKVAGNLNSMGYTNRRGNKWNTNRCSRTFKGVRHA